MSRGDLRRPLAFPRRRAAETCRPVTSATPVSVDHVPPLHDLGGTLVGPTPLAGSVPGSTTARSPGHRQQSGGSANALNLSTVPFTTTDGQSADGDRSE